MENLETYGVQEMSPVEIQETSGGQWGELIFGVLVGYFFSESVEYLQSVEPISGYNPVPDYPVCDNV